MADLRVTLEPNQSLPIVIVSGLPRSGTSLMMRMLEAGGLPPLTDQIREADPDNPRGYYEFEAVKQLARGDHGWLPEARGRAVKVISALLKFLPPDQRYLVLFMRRNMDEILASQRAMLERRGEASGSVGDDEMARLFAFHLAEVNAWLDSQPHMPRLDVDYNALLQHPEREVEAIGRFLGSLVDSNRMVTAIDPALYRNRLSRN